MEPHIPAELKKYSDRIAAFARRPLDYPIWTVPTATRKSTTWHADNAARIQSMRIPDIAKASEFSQSRPDMLLYNLGNLEALDPSFGDRLADFTSGDDHLLLVNVSGAGKTRLVFETLARHWGAYFTCYSDVGTSPYGDADLMFAISKMETDDPLRRIWDLGPRARTSLTTLANNRRIARHQVSSVILARLLVFHVFYSAVQHIDTSPDDLKKKWLLLQLRPEVILDGCALFHRIWLSCYRLQPAVIDEQISLCMQLSGHVLEFVAVDEAQMAMQAHAQMFMSPDRHAFRPLLGELVSTFLARLPDQRLILSGTHLSTDFVDEACIATHTVRRFRSFHGLGVFNRGDAAASYIQHFLADTLEPAETKVVVGYLHGRHRFLNVFISYCLMLGANRWREILNTILRQTTGYRAPQYAHINEILLANVISNERLDACTFAPFLRRSLFATLLNGEKIILDSHKCVEGVALGIAVFASDGRSAKIYEHLVFLNLVRWLRESSMFTISALARRHLQSPTAELADSGLYYGVAAVFWDALQNREGSLRDLLRFHGTTPAWASSPASIVLPNFRTDSCAYSPPENAYHLLVQHAKTPAGVFAWFQRPIWPFLIPDPNFGADMLCLLSIGSLRLLVCFYTDHGSLASLRFKSHVVLPQPERFYEKDAESQMRLRKILSSFSPVQYPTKSGRRLQQAKYSVLRVVCFADLQDSSRDYNPPVAYFRSDLACQFSEDEIDFDVVVDYVEEHEE
ncbi:hypothetical protein EXIGLDRAFT_831736 [Exidia glandulosa HHB12029]|uniref:Uncharacterized protein n=1 Tax=Exidia glandulosa HHB12029 TaxID=1314781 RepID=A0A165MFB3_EXIGL|nr:hypothetical protein EXIGLDRAFT_831736 [Exidia glandulosa HHB12029]